MLINGFVNLMLIKSIFLNLDSRAVHVAADATIVSVVSTNVLPD